MIPVYKPFWPSNAKQYAVKALEDGWLTNHRYNDEVEEYLADMLGVRHVLLVCNGTAAMHLVAKGLKFKHPNIDKVIVPNIVYVAAWNAFLFDKEYSIQMAKTHQHTWNFSNDDVIAKCAEDPSHTAILAVHNLGNPVNVPLLKEKTSCPIVEDACEALFGKYQDKPIPSESLVGALSFFGNKTVTSGEGGAVVTNDDSVAAYLKKLRGQGQTDRRYIHDELGYNYRMTNVQAGILKGQLEYKDEILQKKRDIFGKYHYHLASHEGITLQSLDEGSMNLHSSWMFGIVLDNHEPFDVKQKFFNSRGVDIRPMFYPMNFHTHLNVSDKVKMCDDPVGDSIARGGIMLPSYPDMTEEEQDVVINTVLEYTNNNCIRILRKGAV